MVSVPGEGEGEGEGGGGGGLGREDDPSDDESDEDCRSMHTLTFHICMYIPRTYAHIIHVPIIYN